jgi:hypothetical protein
MKNEKDEQEIVTFPLLPGVASRVFNSSFFLLHSHSEFTP